MCGFAWWLKSRIFIVSCKEPINCKPGLTPPGRLLDRLECKTFQEKSVRVCWRKRRKYRRWRKRERARAGIEPTAAAPSQPDCPGVSRSDHSAGSKESASWRALEPRSVWHLFGFSSLPSTSEFISSRCLFSCHSPPCPAPVRPGCLFCLFLSLLSPSSQPPIDRVSPNVVLKLVTKPILLNRLSGLSD